MVNKEGPLTSLSGDDCNVVPVLTLPVQLHSCGDETSIRGDAKQSLRIWLRINGEPGGEKAEKGYTLLTERRVKEIRRW